jgi:hypothetical protein
VLISKYYTYLEDRFDFTIAEGDFTARASHDVNLAREPTLGAMDRRSARSTGCE